MIKQPPGTPHDREWEQFAWIMPWLLPQHAGKLHSSGISEEVAKARGYESVEDEARLEQLGFAPYQRRAPGLLIPLYDGKGRITTHQFRPDDPRLGLRRNRKPRPVKYETPIGSNHRLDAPPGVGQIALEDQQAKLIITEGPLKADSAVSAGYPALSVAGVWAWSGPAARADFRCINWRQRRVFLVFDSDARLKPAALKGELALSDFLHSLGASVLILELPDQDDGSNQGLDDYLASGERLRWWGEGV
jgi:hypothetical protein